ncbi:hypothetical protein KDA00_03735, partial [Candidatus Saccharibacteria bacterium]|nr:hypothetical protein [Candidatus Saccharibacteria bacterium]
SGNNSDVTEPQNEFRPIPTSGLSFKATITTTSGDDTYTGIMQYDHESGNVSYASETEGQKTLTIYTSDAYYLCSTETECIKYANNQIGANSFNPDNYQYTDEDFTDFKNSAHYEGKKECPAGTCDVWKVTKDNIDTMIYLDVETMRISQVEGSTPTGSSKIVYEFMDVRVEPPANAQEINLP